MVLWCDGGEGGVSGVAGMGISEITRVGAGSWTRTVGIAWPFDESRTVYARGGDLGLLAVAFLMTTGVWIGPLSAMGRVQSIAGKAMAAIRARGQPETLLV